MTILLTGGSGFLGSHVAEQLSKQGRPVRALVRRSSDTSFLETLDHVELAQGAVDDRQSLDAAMDGVEAIVHSAGLVKARRPEDFDAVNVEGTRNLLAAAKRAGTDLRRFVHVSSLAAVGPSPSNEPVDPAQEEPVTHYGRSKLKAEKVALDAADDVPVTIIRPPMIYGPRDREALAFFRSVSQRTLPHFGDGKNTMSVIYGADAGRACVQAIDADVPSGSRFFVDDGEIYVWIEMLEEIERALGKRAWIRFGLPFGFMRVVALGSELVGKLTGKAVMLTRDKLHELAAPHWVCSSLDTREALEWTPEVGWSEGVRLTAEWYRSAGWL
ncbi:MAG: NAD-dependent epimerase/dehydratase family protein [Deltaproteobacteria bacterium]|jgi:nucleoside-diphosphate-sugar epimerase|nr:NAD-dependent epimerase/dehydratase family protein [Deltaproteobacteria bacterium]MBW2537245.1 NAD-dependent epimerase/dehydratase family protein [Deltaproteobacteria bacterium]